MKYIPQFQEKKSKFSVAEKQYNCELYKSVRIARFKLTNENVVRIVSKIIEQKQNLLINIAHLREA